MVEEGELRSRGIGRDEERVSPEKKEEKARRRESVSKFEREEGERTNEMRFE